MEHMHYWVKGFGKREEWSGGCNSLCFPLPTPTSQCSNWRILISGCEWRLSVVQTRWFRYHPCTTHKDISTHTAEISIFLLIIGINNSILFKKWRIFCTRLLTAVTDYWNQMAKAILEIESRWAAAIHAWYIMYCTFCHEGIIIPLI